MVLMNFTKRCKVRRMSTLKAFLMRHTVAQREDFAKRCGTTWPFLRNVAYGYRTAGEKLCIEIDRESGGAVPCESLRPDVDWGYLAQRRLADQPAEAEVGHE